MNTLITGFVTDNQDPDSMGRVKLAIYLSEIPTETDWLPMVSHFAGDDKGIFSLPDTGDMVLAAFMDEDYKKGYVMGGIWPQAAAIPLSEENPDADLNGDGGNNIRYFRSRSGQRIILDDTDGAEKIQVLNPDGTSRIELDGENELINLQTELDVTLNAAGMISLTAEEMEITVDGDLTGQCENVGLEASGDLSVEGNSVALEGNGVEIN